MYLILVNADFCFIEIGIDLYLSYANVANKTDNVYVIMGHKL